MPAKASTKGAPKAAPNAAEKVKNAAKSAPRAAERAPGNVVSPVTDIDAVNMEHYHEVDAALRDIQSHHLFQNILQEEPLGIRADAASHLAGHKAGWMKAVFFDRFLYSLKVFVFPSFPSPKPLGLLRDMGGLPPCLSTVPSARHC